MDGNKSGEPQQERAGGEQPSRNDDKLDNLIKKWQREAREEIKKKGEKEFDFLGTDPSGLTDRIKDSTRQFVEEEWGKLSFYARAKNIVRQFYKHSNPQNEMLKEEPTFILKTRRIEYVFERMR
jgi:hypothetical protein